MKVRLTDAYDIDKISSDTLRKPSGRLTETCPSA